MRTRTEEEAYLEINKADQIMFSRVTENGDLVQLRYDLTHTGPCDDDEVELLVIAYTVNKYAPVHPIGYALTPTSKEFVHLSEAIETYNNWVQGQE